MDTSRLPPELKRWADLDPDGETVAQLLSLFDSDPDAAQVLFDGRIGFGTAGLRATMAPGPRSMNRMVVRQTTAGLMTWFRTTRDLASPLVLIGYDARHRSADFASDVADEVVAGGGVAMLLDAAVPTPVAAHEMLVQGADAAVVITASHNPPADNGYKLYLQDGIQLVPPADEEIALAIDRVVEEHLSRGPAKRDEPVLRQLELVTEDGQLQSLSAAAATERHRAVAIASLRTGSRSVNVLYSAMHGVGGEAVVAAMVEAGFPAPAVVDEQFDPDPDFRTTPFPNPEEPGALDLAFEAAEHLAATGPAPDLILANDPDADRLAVAVPTSSGWKRLTGDEVGALLADHLLRHHAEARSSADGVTMVASSIVSSRFIDQLASHHGAISIRTLTGFKWVARPVVERPHDHYVFGYEEALGYCVNPAVRDKDGLSAALVMAEIAAACNDRSETILDLLDGLVSEFGLYATGQVSIGFGQLSDDDQAELRARAARLGPETMAGLAVVNVEYLSEGRVLPPTEGVVMELSDASRVIVRPSGTEPKIKAYLEVIEDASAGVPVAELRQNAQNRLARLEEAVRRLLLD